MTQKIGYHIWTVPCAKRAISAGVGSRHIIEKESSFGEKVTRQWKKFRCYILDVDIMKVDPQAFQKISKRYFLRDIEKFFQEMTPMGPEPHQFFSF